MSLPRADSAGPPRQGDLAGARVDDDEDDLLLALAEEIDEGDGVGQKAEAEEQPKATETTLVDSTKERPRPPPPPQPPAAAAAAAAAAPPPRQQQQQQQQQKQQPTLRPLQAPVFELGGPTRRPEQNAPRIGGPFVDLLSRLRVARPLPVPSSAAASTSYSSAASSFTSSSSSSSLVEAMGAQFARLDQLKSTLSGEARRDGLWATAGVVTFKGQRKASGASSASSSSYSSSSSSSPMLQLVLADLAGTEVPLVTLGARAADAAEALALGCVVAVVGATAKRRASKSSSSSSSSFSAAPFSLSAGDAAVLLPLGPSADYGTCGARTRDGGSCRRAVNKSECPVCDLHVSAVASRLRPGAGQGALRDSALSAHVLGSKRRAESGFGGGGHYGKAGDNSSRARGAAAARAAAADAALGLPQAREAAASQERDPVAAVARAAAAAAGGRATHGVRLLGRNVVGRAVEQGAGGGGEDGREEEEEEEELLSSSSGGEESGDDEGAAAAAARRQRRREDPGSAFEAAAAAEATAAEVAAAKRRRSEALLRRALSLRQSGSSFDPNRVERSSAAGRAALSKLRASGKEARGSGGSGVGGGIGSGRGTTQQQQQHRSAFAAAFAAQESNLLQNSENKPASSRYGDIGEDAVLRGVGIGSGSGEGEKTGSLRSTIAALEAKDAVEQRAASLGKLVVRAFCCPCCRYTAEFPTKECVARGHAPTRISAVKRWWRCAGCGARSATVGVRYPEHACRSCRCPAKRFERATAGGESSAGKCGTVGAGEVVAERGGLKARGQEYGKFGVFG